MASCAKPGCRNLACVVLGYSYAERIVLLEDAPGGEVPPHAYALCRACAERLSPPRGWSLDDRRASPPLFLDELPRVSQQLFVGN